MADNLLSSSSMVRFATPPRPDDGCQGSGLPAHDAIGKLLEKAQKALTGHQEEVCQLRSEFATLQSKLKSAGQQAVTASASLPGRIGDVEKAIDITDGPEDTAQTTARGTLIPAAPPPENVPAVRLKREKAKKLSVRSNDLFVEATTTTSSGLVSGVSGLRDSASAAHDTLNTCIECGNIFLSDALFCRKCGKARLHGKRLSKGGTQQQLNHDAILMFKVLPAWVQHKHQQGHIRAQTLVMNRLQDSTAKGVKNSSRASRVSSLTSSMQMDQSVELRSTAAESAGGTYGSETDSTDSEGSEISETQKEKEELKWFTVSPYSSRRGLWDVASLILVMYDMIVIPLDFFDPPETTFMTTCNWIARIFWTIDIAASLITGYVTADGSIVMNQQAIMKRYLRTWLILDLAVVAIDWAELFARQAAAASYARVGKVTRTFRIIRMARLLRIARMKEVLDLITERFNSQRVYVFADISKLMFVILGLAHLIACVWFGIGVGWGTPPRTWVYESQFANRPIGDQYCMSLHWSISQFMGGMDEITPENPGERIYAMICLLVAFVLASFFISSLTSSMTELQILGSSEAKKVSMLRGYMAQHKISSKLLMRVVRNALYGLRDQSSNTPEDKVELLLLVSEPLRMDLHFEIFTPVFRVHPYFKSYMEGYPHAMRRVVHSACTFFDISVGDVIFSAGEIPAHPKMYFVCSGSLEYVWVVDEKLGVEVGQWVSEAVLWTLWMHRGDFTAMSNCRLCALESEKFQEIASSFHYRGVTDPKIYAQRFVKNLTARAAMDNNFHDLTDFSWYAARTPETLNSGLLHSRNSGATWQVKPSNQRRISEEASAAWSPASSFKPAQSQPTASMHGLWRLIRSKTNLES